MSPKIETSLDTGYRERHARRPGTLSMMLTLLGGLLLVSTMLFLATHLEDRIIFSVGVPGIVAGLVLVVLGRRLSRA